MFFSVCRPPPRSTLFPYTTLFRSHAAVEAAGGRFRRRATAERRADRDARPLGRRGRARGRGRRKSTRLNSSHVETSYAACCLKKKTRLPVAGAPRGTRRVGGRVER